MQQENDVWTLYFIDGEKIFAPGTTLINAIENIKLPANRLYAIEYFCKGRDESFALEFIEKENVHRWKIKNAQQIYNQLDILHNEIHKATLTITQWKDYLTFVMTKIKQLRDKQKTINENKLIEENEIDKIVEEFFIQKSKSESSKDN
ncbi:hypothetical protein KY334_04295, partial [Candidatus Woesearchaeota archaeon]|nr:hypothetical protein [Candidatus Woesearchaeota archaeon]